MQTSEKTLAERIGETLTTHKAVSGSLLANDRVIGRVTDGIYRAPWSAFRELISNAYDADATEVSIDTDYPFFETIKISDNGLGFTKESLAHLLENIGGSSKRTATGKKLGTTAKDDATKSPGGRPLIGKIGIGLFAVAQLTDRFQIISRRRGSKELVSATVSINTYREDTLLDDDEHKYESGNFKVIMEPDPDEDVQGTTIILFSIRKQTRRELQSHDVWQELTKSDEGIGELNIVTEPLHHVGTVGAGNAVEKEPNLPWAPDDLPLDKFKALFAATADRSVDQNERAELGHLDNYLQMLWRLSLSVPVAYLDGHPFDIHPEQDFRLFELSNEPKGQPDEYQVAVGKTIRDKMGYQSGRHLSEIDFKVLVDGVELRRPVTLPRDLRGDKALEKPMIFTGKCESVFESVDDKRGGGKLSFEAYLYWNSRIIPKESIGALVRVRESSGTLFDPEFLAYKISEQTRKRQITCEIFVGEGLDGAINIDRESFNTSHPHYLYVQKWVHNAFRQFANTHKKIGKEYRKKQKNHDASVKLEGKREFLAQVWETQRGDSEPIPETVRNKPAKEAREVDAPPRKLHLYPEDMSEEDVSRAEDVALLLEAHDILEGMSEAAQTALIVDIIELFKKYA